MKKNILISSAGKRVSLVKAFKQELKSYFPESLIFTCDSNPELSAACAISDGFFKVPRLDDSSYITELVKQCNMNNIGLIIPTIDTELLLLSENQALLSSKGIEVVISSNKIINTCRDKSLIHSFFKSNNVTVAEEYNKVELKFPLFIKPRDGSRSIDTFVINTKDDLTDYHFSNEKFMFLEYIDHSQNDEYTCDTYYGLDNQLKSVVPRKRIEVRDGEVNKGKTDKNELVDYIKQHLNEINGARGCLTMQFFLNRNTRKIVAIEINPRFGGGYPLAYISGANFPKWIIEEYFLKKEISYFENWEDDLLMLRYDDEIIIRNYEA
jgi:carbamoyl-phosphate synthase large subunit